MSAIQKHATRDKLVVFAFNWREDEDSFWQPRSALNGLRLTLLSGEVKKHNGIWSLEARENCRSVYVAVQTRRKSGSSDGRPKTAHRDPFSVVSIKGEAVLRLSRCSPTLPAAKRGAPRKRAFEAQSVAAIALNG